MKTIIECPTCGRTHIERCFRPLGPNSFGPLVIIEVCPECVEDADYEKDKEEEE